MNKKKVGALTTKEISDSDSSDESSSRRSAEDSEDHGELLFSSIISTSEESLEDYMYTMDFSPFSIKKIVFKKKVFIGQNGLEVVDEEQRKKNEEEQRKLPSRALSRKNMELD